MKTSGLKDKLKKIAKLDIAMLFGLISALLFTSFTAFSQQCEEMQTAVFRLHILANSDSAEDQSLKYELRDFILSQYGERLSDSDSLNSAENKAFENLDEIERAARVFVVEKGYCYDVNCEIVNMYFDTRVYENITMPAGNYDALRITIGTAEGKNWWCVMYPPLCLPAATNISYFTEEESKLIEDSSEIQYKFAIYEWFKAIFAGI